MVDTKFLVITILCYVGIFVVIFAVFCCAWLRYIRNEGKSPRARNRQPIARPRFQSSEQQPLAGGGTPSPAYFHQHQSHATSVGYPSTHFHIHRDDRHVVTSRGGLHRVPFMNKHFPVELNFPPGSQNSARYQTGHSGLAYRETSQELSDISDVSSSRYNDTPQQERDLDEEDSAGGFSGLRSQPSCSGSETCDTDAKETFENAPVGDRNDPRHSTHSYSENCDDLDALSVESGHL